MPTRTGNNSCKVCKKDGAVEFTYWETASGIDPYRTNYEENLAQAFICKPCKIAYKEELKNSGKEICSKCWEGVTWGNFDYTPFIKTIGENCSHCKSGEGYSGRTNHAEEAAQRDYEAKKKILEEEIKKVHQQRINEAFACKGICGRIIPLNEKCYTWPQGSSDFYCEPCIINKLSNKQNINNHSGKTCSECNSNLATGETYYPFPNDPSKIICQTCKNQLELSQAYLEAMQQEVNITERINKNIILPAHRTNLLSAQKILKGEQVDIDNLTIDEEDKQFLRQLQQQNPSKNNFSNYSVNCQNCSKKYQVTTVPPHCQHCQSRSIKVYDKAGFLQILPLDNNQQNNQGKKKDDDDIPPYIIIPIGLILAVSSFFFYRWWKKRKKVKHY